MKSEASGIGCNFMNQVNRQPNSEIHVFISEELNRFNPIDNVTFINYFKTFIS